MTKVRSCMAPCSCVGAGAVNEQGEGSASMQSGAFVTVSRECACKLPISGPGIAIALIRAAAHRLAH